MPSLSLQLGAALLLAAAGCKSDPVPATQVLVTVESDLTVGRELTHVRIDVRDAAGMRTARHTFELTAERQRGDQVRLPFSFGVAKRNLDAFQLVATGLNGSDPVVELKVKAAFQDRKTLGLKLFLAAACTDTECPAAQTCYPLARRGTSAGECGDIPTESLDPVTPGEELPDAGMDEDMDAAAGGGAGESGRGGRGGAGAGGAGAGGAGAGGAGAGGAAGGPACESCRPGERCVEGRCECPTTVQTYFEDFDKDGHGDPNVSMMVCGDAPEGYVTSSDDCCDLDADAFPGQEEGFDVPTFCGDDDYDYDCNGIEELGFPVVASGTCCTATEQPGWYMNGGYIPGCGETQQFTLCDQTTCEPVVGPLAQLCR